MATIPQKQPPRFTRAFTSLVVILFLTALAYSNIYSNEFVMDDFDYISDWQLIRDLTNIPRFFFGFLPPEGQGGIYSPLKTLLHALVVNIGGVDPMGFHLLGIFTHLAGTFAVYLLTWTLLRDRWIAFMTGVLFGLHPVHVEAVTPMTAITDTLGVVAMLYAFYYYIRAAGYSGMLSVGGRQDGGADVPQTMLWGVIPVLSRADYYRSLGFGLFAVFTHELTVALPVLLVFYDLFFRSPDRSWKATAARVLPFFLLVFLYVGMKWLNLGSVTRGGYLMGSFYLTLMVIIKAWAKYLGLLVLPWKLTHNHPISPGISSYDSEDFDDFAVLSQSPVDPQTMLSLFVLIAVAVMGVMAYRKRPLVSFAVGWLFLSLSPVSGIIPSSVYLAERYLYHGSWAFCLLVAYGLSLLYERPATRRLAVMVILILVAFYTGRTFARNMDWRDQLTVFETAVRNNPQSATLRHDLGVVYFNYGEFEKAKASFAEAIRLKPNDAHFYFSAENVYSEMQDYETSAALLKKAIELNPDFAEAHYNLAGLYFHQDNVSEALVHLSKAVDLYEAQGRVLEAGQGLISLTLFYKAKAELFKNLRPEDIRALEEPQGPQTR